ncbi:MAG TPA: formimidoylglutamase [Sphingobacteriaceae bacterium]
MANLKTYTWEEALQLTSCRLGETKLGEGIEILTGTEDLEASESKFVLLGICEDLGVRANLGIGGAHTAWPDALKALVNVQFTEKLAPVALLGYLDFSEEMQKAESLDVKIPQDLQQLREMVSMVDQAVSEIVAEIFKSGKKPILVGGGHNNAYPIIKAFTETRGESVNVINLDAHADFRALEGRHSGNGFSYAFHENHLHKYAVLGLHENYNSHRMVKDLQSYPERIYFEFQENFLKESTSYDKAFAEALNFTQGNCGLEIDLDCISGTLSSAMSPAGFSLQQVRELVYQTQPFKMGYLHISEGATELRDGRRGDLTGKTIAYLITDFIKAQS